MTIVLHLLLSHSAIDVSASGMDGGGVVRLLFCIYLYNVS
jgi:hypothetical protein